MLSSKLTDDGCGINMENVREKAIEKGLLEPTAETEEREIIDFIFTPGFSTKESRERDFRKGRRDGCCQGKTLRPGWFYRGLYKKG